MDVFENFKNQLKANPKTIVFTEGTDARILSAASKLLAGKILNVLLLGTRKQSKRLLLRAALTLPAQRSATRPLTLNLTQWLPKWLNCARVR